MTGARPRVGVLALQGDVREHLEALRRLGAHAVPVRRARELDEVAGLVLPGGESSVIDKLARAFGVAEPIRSRIAAGMPVYGTCAGLILLADRIVDGITGQRSFGGLDVAVRRNAFGTQLDSFEADLRVPAFGAPPTHAVFIRAPIIESAGASVTPLVSLPDGRLVAVEQGALVGTAFHPEISDDLRFHDYFLEKVRAAP